MPSTIKRLVTVPEDKGIVIKSAGRNGDKYVYKQTRYFRNEDGKPRNSAAIIGRLNTESGKMHPNDRYFELYNVSPQYAGAVVYDYGYSYIFLKCARSIGMYQCLEASFGERTMDILVMAAYIIRMGNAMDGIDDWQVRNYFPDTARTLNSQMTSRICGALSYEQRNAFFKSWVKQSLTNGTVCYDVTSISSYSQEMVSVERGYNRDGDDLAQFNLGMFCDEITKTPLYYNRYSGSLTDRTNLSCVLANAKGVGIKHVKMVLDGGFWSEEALTNLDELCDAFSVGMPAKLKESEAAIAELGKNIVCYANELSNHGAYCATKAARIYGISGKIFVYFDAQNQVTQCKDLSELIERLKGELSKLKRYPKSKYNRYEPYFKLTKHEQGSGFDYEVDVDKVDVLRKNKGFFLIFSTDTTGTPDDILNYYRGKDADEKIFAQIKVDMDGNRIRTHNEQTTDGKTFVTFIACVLRSYMLRTLIPYLSANSTSMKKIYNQLSNIVTISVPDEPLRLMQALTKKQKDILTAFDALVDFQCSFN
jgi:transposase